MDKLRVIRYLRSLSIKERDAVFKEVVEDLEKTAGTQRTIPVSKQIVVSGDIGYILIPQKRTYALGVQALQNACARDSHSSQPRLSNGRIRSLSFKENIEARVRGYRSSGDGRVKLFDRWLDSCTGVAYKANTSRMKIIPVCTQLVEIAPDFRSEFLPTDYDTLEGIELDTADGTKYGELLTRDEILTHPAWLAAVEGDDGLLRDYMTIVFRELSRRYKGKDQGMKFWARADVTTDELKVLLVENLLNDSDADGSSYLGGNGGSFVRVSQVPQR